MTFASATGALVLYVNGQAVASATQPGSIITSDANVVIGGEAISATFRPFPGLIDELAIYDRALSAEEIAAIASAQAAGKCPPSQVVAFTSTPPSPAIMGQTYDVTASGGRSGNPIVFSSLTPDVCTVSGSTATLAGAGTCTIAADQAGNDTYADAVQATQSFDILPACAPAPAGEVSWWRAEGDATDAVSGNDGTLQNGPAFASGYVGQAFSLGGSDDWVIVGNPASLKLTGSLTIESWVKPTYVERTGEGIYHLIASKWGQSEGLDSYWFGLVMTGGAIRLLGVANVMPPAGGTAYVSVENGAVQAGQWNHVAMSFEPFTGALSIYVNGQLVGSAGRQGALYTSDVPVIIGGEAIDPGFRPFPGLLDELTIYNRALSAQEIGRIRSAGAAGKCEPEGTVNHAPTAAAGGPYAAAEGTSIAFDAGGSGDPDGGPLTYAWNFGDGSTGTGATPSHVYADDGSYVVTLGVTDGVGSTAVAFATATIHNVAPTGTFNAPASGSENSRLVISIAPVVEPGSGDIVQYAFDCGDGKGYGALTATNNRPCTPADNGRITVKGKVQDDDGGVTEYVGTIDVANMSPSATFSYPSKAVSEGTSFVLSLSKPVDAPGDLATLGYLFDCGTAVLRNYGTSGSATCPAQDNVPANRLVRGQAFDKDGGMSAIYAANVAVVNVPPKVSILSASAPDPARKRLRQVAFSFGDPGVSDAPWSARLDWGDGAVCSGLVDPSVTYTCQHEYSAAFSGDLVMAVTDKDAGQGTARTKLNVK
ncbi:MAG: LamG-like jellyroll fold domain-containing protein [Gemmatimonadales bacterium]